MAATQYDLFYHPTSSRQKFAFLHCLRTKLFPNVLRTIPASLSFIFGLFEQTLQFLQQYNVKNAHPASGAGIRTHGVPIAILTEYYQRISGTDMYLMCHLLPGIHKVALYQFISYEAKSSKILSQE